MSSKNEILAALDAIDDGSRTVAKHLHQLRPVDQRAVLLRLEAVNKQLATTQRSILAGMVSGPTPVEFVGASWADVLARRLRISKGEAERRIADALQDTHPRSA
jgi:hypothetical protein